MKFGDREMEMADLLVKSMSGDFQPAEFHDTYREELLEVIRAKAEGAEYQPVEEKLLPTNVIDLVALLKASIDQAEEQKKPRQREDKKPWTAIPDKQGKYRMNT